ncbi:TetR/AcrR family transcriptional regulator [Yinghuangia sp. ASG 101]|uniref:TetR/AcrR family transcriptional regulator n=1 Tax=Yinghuangia sp. ASG 101 TaxID=2896848 RepID=UPI001E495FA9|nr:TetR/AcrR family transcriptional regulator [Yinghuangia sp. ASG 101]UGQ13842.1 TetR/AcrR family transcriptional regulator [Yinghuangia sp. ASG 101]
MPRPRSLTQPQIAAAALRVLDRDGLDALTMRAVAAELDMGTMSVYRYVTDRAQLEALVVDHVLGMVDTDVPDAAPGRAEAPVAQTPDGGAAIADWAAPIEAMVDRVRATVGAHTAVIPLLLIHRHASPHATRWGEAVLGVLASAGFDARQRAIAFRALLAYVFGALHVEYYSPLPGPGTAALAALDPHDFPHLAATAREARTLDTAEEFTAGLRLLLRGLAAETRPKQGD